MSSHSLHSERTDYDAIIVGASFAGLAVASRIQGRTLIIDKHKIGAFQTSACGTMEHLVTALGCSDSIVNTHHTAYIHTKFATLERKFPRPFCIFDYGKFCQCLSRSTDARILIARVLGA